VISPLPFNSRLAVAGRRRSFDSAVCSGAVFALCVGLFFSACATVERPAEETANRLEETAHLVEDVKNFGQSIGIKPTRALSRTAGEGPALSMLWLWMQRAGTLALRHPIDVRLAIGFSAEKERLKIEQVYRVDGYSVYYRQGNEFSDARAIATVAFAAEPIVRRVIVILHEDLHGDANFALPWEMEEAIVTPLGSLAAREYFRVRGDDANEKSAVAALSNERKVSRELVALAVEAEKLFAQWPIDEAKQRVLAEMEKFPTYRRQFERQTQGQHGPTVLEAKLSHDLAYYRYFDRIVALAELAPNLKTLIADLRALPAGASHDSVEKFLQDLALRYRSAAQ
jgi:hypothetical protein